MGKLKIVKRQRLFAYSRLKKGNYFHLRTKSKYSSLANGNLSGYQNSTKGARGLHTVYIITSSISPSLITAASVGGMGS
jgi:hypothetical protein